MSTAERALLLTVAKMMIKVLQLGTCSLEDRQNLIYQIRAVEAVEALAAAPGMTKYTDKPKGGMFPVAPTQPEPAPADDEADVRELAAKLIRVGFLSNEQVAYDANSGVWNEIARAALAFHREKMAALEAKLRNRADKYLEQQAIIDELRARLAALERPAPEPTEEDIREMQAEIENAWEIRRGKTNGIDYWRKQFVGFPIDAAEFAEARAAYRVAASRRPAPEPSEEELRGIAGPIAASGTLYRDMPLGEWLSSAGREVALASYRVAASRRPAPGVPAELLEALERCCNGGIRSGADWDRLRELLKLLRSQPAAGAQPAALPATTEAATRNDGLHCVYGQCQGPPKGPHPVCNPACYFQGSASP